MRKLDHRDADLLLKLYDLRREAVLREARKFVGSSEIKAATYEEFAKQYPAGSQGSAYISMVVSYWDMVCALVEKGLLDEDLFFTTTYEHNGVWEKLKPYIQGGRAAWGAPWWCGSLERVVTRHARWMKAQSATPKKTPARKASSKKAPRRKK